MRIGYISYEYPDNPFSGGIGTYVSHIAQIMCDRGHDVEVFCATSGSSICGVEGGITINRISCKFPSLFSKAVVPFFDQRYSLKPFDVIESAEYNADAWDTKLAYPRLPLVVRLHTPSFLVDELNNYYSVFRKKKYTIEKKIKSWLSGADKEHKFILKADQIQCASMSLAKIVAERWRLDLDKILIFPNAYSGKIQPEAPLLNNGEGRIVRFIGRLEIRKGIVQLCEALIPLLTEFPDLNVQFIGRNMAKSPMAFISMKQYIRLKLRKHTGNVSFSVSSHHNIINMLKEPSICVFPSIWENFPYVCLEAMSAGCAIIASREGGMSEMLEHNVSALLIDPHDARDIENAIRKLLDDLDLPECLGNSARGKISDLCDSEKTALAAETAYKKVIRLVARGEMPALF